MTLLQSPEAIKDPEYDKAIKEMQKNINSQRKAQDVIEAIGKWVLYALTLGQKGGNKDIK